jgi:hypothetical protein
VASHVCSSSWCNPCKANQLSLALLAQYGLHPDEREAFPGNFGQILQAK